MLALAIGGEVGLDGGKNWDGDCAVLMGMALIDKATGDASRPGRMKIIVKGQVKVIWKVR